MDFLANLLHFKHGSDAYSLDPAKWKSVPLYLKNYADNSVLNNLFFYILSRAVHWQGLRRLAPRTAADVEALCIAEYPQIEESRSGPELPKTAYISKTFVAYFEALVGAAPYFKTTDTRNKLEQRYAKAFKELNKHDDTRFDQYVGRKLRAWYTKFPPTQPSAGGGSDDDGGAGSGGDGQGDTDENEEAMALSGDE